LENLLAKKTVTLYSKKRWQIKMLIHCIIKNMTDQNDHSLQSLEKRMEHKDQKILEMQVRSL